MKFQNKIFEFVALILSTSLVMIVFRMIKDKQIITINRNGLVIFVMLLSITVIVYYIFNKISGGNNESASKIESIKYSLVVSFAVFSNDMLHEERDAISSIIGGIIVLTLFSSIIYFINRIFIKLRKKTS